MNLSYYFTSCTSTNLRALLISTLRLTEILCAWSNKEKRWGSYFFILFSLQGNHQMQYNKGEWTGKSSISGTQINGLTHITQRLRSSISHLPVTLWGGEGSWKKARKTSGLLLSWPSLRNLFWILIVKERSNNKQRCTELLWMRGHSQAFKRGVTLFPGEEKFQLSQHTRNSHNTG